MSIVIGLTGGIASGKSTVTNKLREKGYKVVDCDALTREAYVDRYSELEKSFPACFHDGGYDRQALATLVFGDDGCRKRLEHIIHPYVVMRMRKEIDTFDGNYLFLDIPLLFEANLDYLCDYIWLVYLPQELQLQRLMKRNHFSKEEALIRMQSQMPLEDKKARANVIIDNSRDYDYLYKQIDERLGDLNDRSSHAG